MLRKWQNFTKGYPFAFQVLGYLTWNHEGDYEAVIDEYEQYLSGNLFMVRSGQKYTRKNSN